MADQSHAPVGFATVLTRRHMEPRISIITLGVVDLLRSVEFYESPHLD